MDYKKLKLISEEEFNNFEREEAKQYVVRWFMNESKNPYIPESDAYMAYKLAYLILKDEDTISPYSADSIIYSFWVNMYHSNEDTEEYDKEFMLNQYCKYGLID